MTDDVPSGFSLKRWSKRKLDSTRASSAVAVGAEPVVAARAAPAVEPSSSAAPSSAAASSVIPTGALRSAARPDTIELPPVASLSFDSDFSAFMQPKVAESLKRAALRKLFSDPHFNVMDGLDTYIDDYSIPDPISAEEVRGLVQSRYIFDPPRTRINAQ